MQNLKAANKKIIIMSIITLVITIGLGIFFMVSLNADFVATKTIWGRISGLTFLGELIAITIIIFTYFLILFAANAFTLVINLIARLFQIGESREWKDVITKALLILSIVLQGILNIYILFLCFTGYGLVYISIYLMLIINVFAFIKNILIMRKCKTQTNAMYY